MYTYLISAVYNNQLILLLQARCIFVIRSFFETTAFVFGQTGGTIICLWLNTTVRLRS